MKEIKAKGKIIGFIILIYLAVVASIDRFSHPEFTETELILRFPKVILFDFK